MKKPYPKISLSGFTGTDDPRVCPLCNCGSLRLGKQLGWGYYREIKNTFSTGGNQDLDAKMSGYECPHCYKKICYHINNDGDMNFAKRDYKSITETEWESWGNGKQPRVRNNSELSNCSYCSIEDCMYNRRPK